MLGEKGNGIIAKKKRNQRRAPKKKGGTWHHHRGIESVYFVMRGKKKAFILSG